MFCKHVKIVGARAGAESYLFRQVLARQIFAAVRQCADLSEMHWNVQHTWKRTFLDLIAIGG